MLRKLSDQWCRCGPVSLGVQISRTSEGTTCHPSQPGPLDLCIGWLAGCLPVSFFPPLAVLVVALMLGSSKLTFWEKSPTC